LPGVRAGRRTAVKPKAYLVTTEDRSYIMRAPSESTAIVRASLVAARDGKTLDRESSTCVRSPAYDRWDALGDQVAVFSHRTSPGPSSSRKPEP
jgi:hypothetical protein